MLSRSWLLALAGTIAALAPGPARADRAKDSPATAAPPPAEAPAPDRVVLYAASEPDYAKLSVDADGRTSPGAPGRLVVFHDGLPVLDLGLADERELRSVPGGPPEDLVEEGLVENAEISPDGRSAAILSTRYRRAAPTGSAAPAARDRARPAGSTRLTWVAARRPGARYSLDLEEGLWVKEVVPLSAGHGLVVSTTRGLDAPAELRIYGPDGRVRFGTSAAEGSVTAFTATNNGAFVAVSLEYPDRPGLPQQGILILDLLGGTHWTYTWSYGADNEPVSWSLAESGVLEVRLPGRVVRYDRDGSRIGSERAAPPALAPKER